MTVETILPIPDIFSARRVLCIQPNYDDNDIAAGGTFMQLAKNGAEVIYLTVTDDLAKDFQYGEPFKVLHPRALHCGL